MRLPGDIRPLSKPIRTQCESPLQPFSLCYPLFLLEWEQILLIYRQHGLYQRNM
ncbi:hypothetical protein E2C01_066187 [Portunus trituberculatus]|uniref:Uncharacterized protein n=1 Tax=Portunus trituberculatus TaxID=210409 RepID=A0A5B7HPL2_PORTR|nr:hypothetical protein [Portunus trituberculatus]